MKRPTFFEGVLVAIAVSLAGAALFTALGFVFPLGAILRMVVAGLGLGYVLYLLSRSRERAGRIVMLMLWAVAAAATWFMAPSLTLYLLAHVGLIWLIRSLYFYSSVLSALLDLGLNALALAAAVWAATVTHSVFLSIWCFFLVQALFVAIPKRLRPKTSTGRPEPDQQDRFQHAYHVAESAVRKLSSVNQP
jgi:hypothetical protein